MAGEQPSLIRALEESSLEDVHTLIIKAETPRPKTGLNAQFRGALADDELLVDAPAVLGRAQFLIYTDEAGAVSFHAPTKNTAYSPLSRSLRGGKTVRYRVKLRPTRPGALPDTGQRGILGTIGIKVLKIVVLKLAENVVGRFAYRSIGWWENKHRPAGFHGGSSNQLFEEKPTRAPGWGAISGGDTALLFLHGTTSTTAGAFSRLAERNGLMDSLYDRYGNRVLAFNHHTMSVGIAQNVIHFYEALKDHRGSYTFDIIAHSRGGLLARALAELNDATIGSLAGIPGWRRPDRISVKFRRTIFVGTPNAGTALALPDKISGFLDHAATLANILPEFLGSFALSGILSVVAYVAETGLRHLPGLTDQAPDSDLIKNLNAGQVRSEQYYAIQANFEPRGILAEILKDSTVDYLFDNVENDLVVPTAGVSGGFGIPDDRIVEFSAEAGVHHSNFFSQERTAEAIDNWFKFPPPTSPRKQAVLPSTPIPDTSYQDHDSENGIGMGGQGGLGNILTTTGKRGSQGGRPGRRSSIGRLPVITQEEFIKEWEPKYMKKEEAITVFPSIDPSETNPVQGNSITIKISLSLKRDPKTSGNVELPNMDNQTLDAHVLFGRSGVWGRLSFDPSRGTGTPAEVTIRVPLLDPKKKSRLETITVNFYLGARWCGEARHNVRIRRDATIKCLEKIPAPAEKTWSPGLNVAPNDLPPDMLVRIQSDSMGTGYVWTILSPYLTAWSPSEKDCTMKLGEGSAAFAEANFENWSAVSPGESGAETIRGLGVILYARTPRAFKDAYWELRDKLGDKFEFILFVTDEPEVHSIPWEMTFMFEPTRRDPGQGEFLSVRHSVGRWIPNKLFPLTQHLKISKVDVVATDYAGNSEFSELPWAEEEGVFLKDKFRGVRHEVRADDITTLVQDATVESLHFACHGEMNSKNPWGSAIITLDEDRKFLASALCSPKAQKGISAQRALVFLNACETGGVGDTLRMMAGWPAGFLNAGAGAFIGPLWSVNDKACLNVTKAFYDDAFNGSNRLGEVLKKIRARWIAEGNLTYLAYVLYGDPQATVTFTKSEDLVCTPPNSLPPRPE